MEKDGGKQSVRRTRMTEAMRKSVLHGLTEVIEHTYEFLVNNKGKRSDDSYDSDALNLHRKVLLGARGAGDVLPGQTLAALKRIPDDAKAGPETTSLLRQTYTDIKKRIGDKASLGVTAYDNVALLEPRYMLLTDSANALQDPRHGAASPHIVRVDVLGDVVFPRDAMPSDTNTLAYTDDADGAWVLSSPDSARLLTRPLAEHESRCAVVFIHGHNCTREEAQKIFKGMIEEMEDHWRDEEATVDADYVCVTWAAQCNDSWLRGPTSRARHPLAVLASLAGYADDLDRVALSFRGITMLLKDIAASGRNLHLIAHSMGCQAVIDFIRVCVQDHRVLTKRFYDVPLADDCQVVSKVLGRVITVSLIAPDVPVGVFRASIKDCMPVMWSAGNLARISIFANSADVAIRVSQFLRLGGSRIGTPSCALEALNAPYPISCPIGRLEMIDVRVSSLLGHDIYTDHRVVSRLASAIAHPLAVLVDGQGSTDPVFAPEVLPGARGRAHSPLYFRYPPAL